MSSVSTDKHITSDMLRTALRESSQLDEISPQAEATFRRWIETHWDEVAENERSQTLLKVWLSSMAKHFVYKQN